MKTKKKVIFSLMAIAAMLFTAMSFTSCEKDKEEVTIRVTWAVDYYGEDDPADVKKERDAIVKQIDDRTMEIFGESFSLEADAETARPTHDAILSTYDRFAEDGKIKEYIQKFVDLNTKDNKFYVTNVVFSLYCGSTCVGYDNIKLYE